MPSAYIQQADYAVYGLPASTTAAQVQQASSLIDAYLYRPEGLLWQPDGNGQPCYMAGMSPMLSLTGTGAIAPGANVVVPVTGPAAMLQPGDAVVLDRANANLAEACVVAAAGASTVTLQSVQFNHGASAKLETGLVIEESLIMPKGRPITRVSRTPTLRIISGVGRYAYGRRGDAANFNMDDFNLLAAVSKFGGPPMWEIFSPANTGVDMTTGQVWVPAGVLLSYYTEVKLRYVAGFQYSNLPDVVKFACATLVQALANQPALGNVKSFKAGDTTVQNFTNSVFTDDVHEQLNPFRAHLFS